MSKDIYLIISPSIGIFFPLILCVLTFCEESVCEICPFTYILQIFVVFLRMSNIKTSKHN